MNYIEYTCQNEFCKYEFNSVTFSETDIEMVLQCPHCEMYNEIIFKATLQGIPLKED